MSIDHPGDNRRLATDLTLDRLGFGGRLLRVELGRAVAVLVRMEGVR